MLTSISSGVIFGKNMSVLFIIGVSTSLVLSGIYTYLKINGDKSKHDVELFDLVELSEKMNLLVQLKL